MRTTFDIDDDLLAATRAIAQRERTSAGKVVSRLLRQALTQQPELDAAHPASAGSATTGFRPFASRGVPVTNAEVDRLRDADGV
ncbi:MAG: hypothetical protein ACK5TI_01635 [bacterium]|jgi:hypothetical protein|nr:hypothetical protein [Betaproteobacteria bacterium]